MPSPLTVSEPLKQNQLNLKANDLENIESL